MSDARSHECERAQRALYHLQVMMHLSIWPAWDVVHTADFLDECLRDFEMLRHLREWQVEVVHQVIL